MENKLDPRRWFTFRLRTAFMVVTLLCIYLGWAMNWQHRRKEFLRDPDVFQVEFTPNTGAARAPIGLRLLGEEGMGMIVLGCHAEEWKAEEGKRLFPEAIVQDAGRWKKPK